MTVLRLRVLLLGGLPVPGLGRVAVAGGRSRTELEALQLVVEHHRRESVRERREEELQGERDQQVEDEHDAGTGQLGVAEAGTVAGTPRGAQDQDRDLHGDGDGEEDAAHDQPGDQQIAHRAPERSGRDAPGALQRRHPALSLQRGHLHQVDQLDLRHECAHVERHHQQRADAGGRHHSRPGRPRTGHGAQDDRQHDHQAGADRGHQQQEIGRHHPSEEAPVRLPQLGEPRAPPGHRLVRQPHHQRRRPHRRQTARDPDQQDHHDDPDQGRGDRPRGVEPARDHGEQPGGVRDPEHHGADHDHRRRNQREAGEQAEPVAHDGERGGEHGAERHRARRHLEWLGGGHAAMLGSLADNSVPGRDSDGPAHSPNGSGSGLRVTAATWAVIRRRWWRRQSTW